MTEIEMLKKLISDFFKNLADMKSMLSEEDLEFATETMMAATKRIKELEAKEAERTAPKLPSPEYTDELDSLPLFDEPLVEEHEFDGSTIEELPLDWENCFAEDERAAEHVSSIADGYVLCLNTLGKVDIEYIAQVSGSDPKTVIAELRGSIYQNPETWEECFYKGYESAEEYLSGNISRKYKAAKEANDKYFGRFDDNLRALDAVMPPHLSTEDIYVTLGSPWLPTQIVDDFIDYIIGSDAKSSFKYPTRHDPESGIWEIPKKDRFNWTRASVKVMSTYGTKRMSMLEIIENTLNMKTIEIRDTVDKPGTKNGKASVVNEAETVMALDRQKKILDTFRKWVWEDRDRRFNLMLIYESQYACIRQRHFDGSFLTFPGISPDITLYPYQKNAVARILFTPNTLLAHDVGAGKTYIMIAAGMELKRIGLSKKNLYVVPNNLVGQWRSDFEKLYPSANILVIDPKSFNPNKRRAALRNMRDREYDAVIIAYSCFDMIPVSMEYCQKKYEEAIAELDRSREKLGNIGELKRKKKSLIKKLEKIKETFKADMAGVCLDELGFTRIFLDEAHNYKNVPINTKINNMLGLSSSGSVKCEAMMDKVHSIQKSNGGAGAIFATGTPITNSITDVFVMQKYLQSGELAMLGLNSFDSWVGMFAEKSTEFEIDVDTSNFRLATRFSRFHNLPELTSILSSIADFHKVDGNDSLPKFYGYTDTQIAKTPEFESYLKEISSRAEDVRAGRISRKEDNMLLITTDGKKAALDMRLVDDKSSFYYESKVAHCARNVYQMYRRSSSKNCAQLVFCDSSTPKKGFNMYDELSRLLVSYGVKPEEIAYVHDATTEKQRNDLFAAVRRGDVRILIGSTFKLGLGVNVQERLIAIHHLDVPWRPADMVQRQGRILRQGNLCEEIDIFRYITKGSFDAYSWQLLETKQRFISKLLEGSLTQRSGSDVDDTVLSYAEVKALAVGNPLIKERVELSNELNRYYILQREAVIERELLKTELAGLPQKIERQEELMRICREDIAYYKENKREYSKEELRSVREEVDRAIKANFNNPQETEALTYQGFKVIVPAHMSEEKPYVYLVGKGKYILEMGAEAGVTRRLDFFLDEFDRQYARFDESLQKLKNRAGAIEDELKKTVGYTDKIDELNALIEEIDKKLGVKKK